MRIEAIGINMQSFTVNENTSIADNNESFSEIIDELSDEMSKTDTDVEHTKRGCKNFCVFRKLSPH